MSAKRKGLGMTQSNMIQQKCSMSRRICGLKKLRGHGQCEEGVWKKNLLSSKRRRKGHECEVCFLTFCSIYSLRRHLKRYKDLTYSCNECGTKLRDAERLQSHIKYAHRGIVSKKYKLICPVCKQMTNLEASLRSHLCHYHTGWEDMNLDIFASKSCPDETATSYAINDGDGNKIVMSKRTKKQRVIRLIRYLVKTTFNDKERTTRGNNTSGESFNKNCGKSDASIDDKSGKAPVEIYGMANEVEALLSDAGVREEKTKRRSFNGLHNREDFKRVRNTRSTKNNFQNTFTARRESDLNGVDGAFNDIPRKTWRQLTKERSTDACNRINRDARLRILYSCKDCYVPLPRINWTRNTPIATEVSTYPADDSEICREMRGPEKQLQNKSSEQQRQHQERKKNNQFQLADVEVRLEKLPNSNVFIELETDDYDSYEPSIVLEECSDPLGFSSGSEADNCDVDESSTEMNGSLAQYPASVNLPLETEVVNCDTGEISGVGTESFGQCQKSVMFPLTAEAMNCDVDEHSAVTTESFAECPEPLSFEFKSEIVNYEFIEPSSEFTETDNHAACETSDYRTVDAAAADLERLNPDTPRCDTSTFSESGKKTQVEQGRTMIASRICDKLFTGRRAMLRHCREHHLKCFGDTVYCTCGKEMIGRRAVENHFSGHCDKVIITTKLASNPCTPCKPLEKNHQCAKCGQKFWLETCLYDHPPHCECLNMKVIQKNRRKDHFRRAFGIVNHVGDTGEHVCRVCDAKFTSVDRLLRHVRTFATNKRYSCPICRTEFSGMRLLKGHVQSTHVLVSTTLYTSFCDFCNQGFTKRLYRRIHMMHVHSNQMSKSTGGATDNNNSTAVADSSVPPVMKTPDNQCNVCNLVFVNRKRFMDHISYYNRNDLFRCHICGEGFQGQYRAHHHRKKVHYDGNMLNAYTHCCVVCKEGFMYKTHLHAHILHVHDKESNCVSSVKNPTRSEQNGNSANGDFACNLCPKKFRTDSILLAHIDSYHAGNAMPSRVKCSRCNDEFSTWSGWIFHLKNSHIADPKDPLGFRFTNSVSSSSKFGNTNNSISDGMFGGPRVPNAETPRPHTTDQINPQESTSEKLLLDRGTLNVPTDGDIPTRCTTCGFDCSDPGGLARHRAMYLNSGIYVCELCGRRFTWQSFYRDHKLKHFRRDVYNECFCPICDEGFETIQCLQMHTIHLHHQSLDELQSVLYKCPNCEQKYETVELLQQHLMSMHNQHNPIDEGDTPEHSTNSLHDHPTCNICNKHFTNKEMLKIHRTNCHSVLEGNDSATQGPECLANRQGNPSSDRFYVLFDDNIHPKAVDSIRRSVYECNKAMRLTNNLYRYEEASWKCKACNLTFASKYLLNVHHEMWHEIRVPFQHVNDNVNQKRSSQITAVGTSPNRIQTPTSIPLLQPEAKGPQTLDEVSQKVVECTSPGSVSKISPTTFQNQFNYYKCRVCDIIFIEENLLAIHEQNVHGLKIADDDEGSNEGPNEGFPQSRNTVIVVSEPRTDDLPLEPENDNLPTTPSAVTQHNQSASNPESVSTPMSPEEILILDNETEEIVISDDETEEIFISDDETDVNELSSISKNPSFSANKISSTSPHGIRLVKLPPGNYKIAKLKVRSVDTAGGKLMRTVKSPQKTR